MTTTELAQLLTDRYAITELAYRYCRSVDRIDVALGHSIWHPGATADYGDFYQGHGPGVIDLICAQHKQLLGHAHQMSNIIIEINGDQAGSESYVTATLRLQKGEQIQQMTVWSRYVDTWSRRDGQWGLDKRIAIRDFDEIRPVTPMSHSSVGSRDRNDPSCKVLSF
jgi:hypothetical protein